VVPRQASAPASIKYVVPVMKAASGEARKATRLATSSGVPTRGIRLVEFQVDGTEGSAVAGLHNCVIQHRAATPKPVWNPDLAETNRYREHWQEVPDNLQFDNGFKAQWEQFLRYVGGDAEHAYDFLAGARGVRLAEAGLQSSTEGRRIELAEITL
jgi:predicted dehydrogenase